MTERQKFDKHKLTAQKNCIKLLVSCWFQMEIKWNSNICYYMLLLVKYVLNSIQITIEMIIIMQSEKLSCNSLSSKIVHFLKLLFKFEKLNQWMCITHWNWLISCCFYLFKCFLVFQVCECLWISFKLWNVFVIFECLRNLWMSSISLNGFVIFECLSSAQNIVKIWLIKDQF